jgi:cell division septation protein DedD
LSEKSKSSQDDRGLSGRQMVMILLAVVAVCAVFFAAGFVVGVNERNAKDTPTTERVQASDVIPPTVNQPLDKQKPAEEGADQTRAPQVPTPIKEENPRKAAKPAAKAAPPPEKPPAASASGATGSFAVQVAASSSLEDAAKIVKTLKSRGFPAFFAPPDKAGDGLYRVQVGPYPTREAAEQVKPRLEQEGFKQPFIKH